MPRLDHNMIERMLTLLCTAEEPYKRINRINLKLLVCLVRSDVFMGGLRKLSREDIIIDMIVACTSYDRNTMDRGFDLLVNYDIDLMVKRTFKAFNREIIAVPAFASIYNRLPELFIRCSLIEYFAMRGYFYRRHNIILLNWLAFYDNIVITFGPLVRAEKNDGIFKGSIVFYLIFMKRYADLINLINNGYVLSNSDLEFLTSLVLEKQIIIDTTQIKSAGLDRGYESFDVCLIEDKVVLGNLIKALIMSNNRYKVDLSLYLSNSETNLQLRQLVKGSEPVSSPISDLINDLILISGDDVTPIIAQYDSMLRFAGLIDSVHGQRWASVKACCHQAELHIVNYHRNYDLQSLKKASYFAYIASHGIEPFSKTWLPHIDNSIFIELVNRYLSSNLIGLTSGEQYFAAHMLKRAVLQQGLHVSLSDVMTINTNLSSLINNRSYNLMDYIQCYLYMAKYVYKGVEIPDFQLTLENIIEDINRVFDAQIKHWFSNHSKPVESFNLAQLELSNFISYADNHQEKIHQSDKQRLVSVLENMLLTFCNEMASLTSEQTESAGYILDILSANTDTENDETTITTKYREQDQIITESSHTVSTAEDATAVQLAIRSDSPIHERREQDDKAIEQSSSIHVTSEVADSEQDQQGLVRNIPTRMSNS